MRLIILVVLVFVGLIGICQFLPIGEYCVGIANTIYFLGLAILYVILFIIERYLDKKESKKKLDQSSIFITIGLAILFLITQSLGIFKSKVIMSAKSENRPAYELLLRENGEYELIGFFGDYNCHYFGEYKWTNDTLEIDGKRQIDSRYYMDKKIIGYFQKVSILSILTWKSKPITMPIANRA